MFTVNNFSAISAIVRTVPQALGQTECEKFANNENGYQLEGRRETPSTIKLQMISRASQISFHKLNLASRSGNTKAIFTARHLEVLRFSGEPHNHPDVKSV